MKKRVVAMLMTVLLLMVTAVAAPENGEIVTVATVDYDEFYWGTAMQYTRIIELQHNGEKNGTLLATYELGTSGLHIEKPGYNIHISHDGGSTWELATTVREKAAAIQSEWQPFFYELTCQLGTMPEGTVILAACSIDAGHAKQTALRLYRSYDAGQTWEQYGTVDTSGAKDGVYEPFLMLLPDGRLACYYTKGEAEGQRLVMRISEDGETWGEMLDVVWLEDKTQLPGMATVAQMNDGRYIMSYEMCSSVDSNCGNPVHYRFSTDGIDWGDPKDPGTKVVTDTGVVPGSSPYIAYVPGYGENGLLLLTSCFQSPGSSKGNVVYINDQLGDESAWKVWFLPKKYRGNNGGYSHATFASADGRTAYFVNDIPDTESEDGYNKMILVRYCFEDDFLTQ